MASTATNSGGTISVPLSSILDALGNTLNEAERAALLERLIGLRATRVQPGDLITSALFNQMLNDINDLAIRIAKLEGATDSRPRPPVITRIDPQVVRTGDEFIVTGENLDPERLTRIDINQTTIPLTRIKPGSGPTQLVLDAPAIMGLPAGGATVIIAVWNADGSAQRGYSQLPGVPANLQANVIFTAKSVPSGNIEPGKPYDYSFELDIHSSHNEQFRLVPQISGPGAGWSAVVKDSDRIDATSASAIAGLKVTKVVTVTTGASGPATLVLSLNGTTNFPSFNASSQPTIIPIGAPQTIPTDQILFNSPSVFGTTDRKYKDGTLWVKRQPAGGTGAIALTVQTQFKIAGAYDISSPTATPATDWQVSRVTAGSININNPDGTSAITINVTPKSSGGQFTAANSVLTFTVASATNSQLRRTFTAQLSVVDTLPPS